MTAPVLARARTATLVIAGSAARLSEAVDMLRANEDDAGSLHIVRVVTEGDAGVDEGADVVTIQGLRPEYVNNAIAAVRLSSLPTVIWWRGGSPEGVDGAVGLSDRLVLDVEDPWPVWRRIPPLFEQAAITDIRWARLTRWRAAMAHFFDLSQVRAASASFSSLSISGGDRAQCALFAGWLDASLGWKGRVVPQNSSAASGAPMETVTLAGDAGELSLNLLPDTTCVNTQARLGTEILASRVVSLGDQSLRTLLAEELRVRSRDLAFERAVERALST